MIFELNDYLDHVDEWKFKLYRKLKRMTPKQQENFWKKSQDKARNLFACDWTGRCEGNCIEKETISRLN